MAQIALSPDEIDRLERFLDSELSPESQPLIEMLVERLTPIQWAVLEHALRRRLEFLCTAWLGWLATVEHGRRLGMAVDLTDSAEEMPAEIHELSACNIPSSILAAFDNSEAHARFAKKWMRLVQTWAEEHQTEMESINFKVLTNEFNDLKRWLAVHGVGDHQEPIENVLLEVFRELEHRAFVYVVKDESFDDECRILAKREG